MLEAEVAELRRQFGQDSSASSKPPSSDGLKKMPGLPGSRRSRSGKARGGQAGHEGGTLRQVTDPDCVVHHKASACGHCGWVLDPKSATDFEKRQVFDLAERTLLITEHQASIYRCEHCRDVNKATRISCANSTARSSSITSPGPNSCATYWLQPGSRLTKRARRTLAPKELAAFVERYWAAVRLGLAFHRELPKLETKASPRGRIKRRPGHSLLQRLKTFLNRNTVLPHRFRRALHQHLAEQDLRMMKVKMKISGSFRTLAGAQIFASLRSIVSTARKHGCNNLQILPVTRAPSTQAFAVQPAAWSSGRRSDDK